MRRPLEVLVPLGVFTAGAIAFVAVGALRGDGSLQFPLIVAVLDLLAALGLWLSWGQARGAALLVSVLVAVPQVMVAAFGTPHWTFRLTAGILAAAHIYAAVLLMTKPARDHLGATRRE